jgi:hypothetical protein
MSVLISFLIFGAVLFFIWWAIKEYKKLDLSDRTELIFSDYKGLKFSEKTSNVYNTYTNICKEGIDVVVPAGSLQNKSFLGTTLKIPQKDVTLNIKVDCDQSLSGSSS